MTKAPATKSASEFRGRIYSNITETVGATPLVRLSRLAAKHDVKAEILAKLEFFNPLASGKDPIGAPIFIPAGKTGKNIQGAASPTERTPATTGNGLPF